MTQMELLRKFADFAAILAPGAELANLPDRASFGLGDLNAGHFRNAATVCAGFANEPTAVLIALMPFADAGANTPERARNWKFGTTPFTYGDFMLAHELLKNGAGK